MDLDDLLEDLLEDAAKAARRRVRRASARGRAVKRGARRAVRTGGTIGAGVLLTFALLLFLSGNAFLQVVGALALLGGLASGGAALAAHLGERRDPRAVEERSRRRTGAPPLPSPDDLRDLPKDVRAEWERLLQARALVADLTRDGWIAGSSQLEVDGLVARLHRLLAADHRTSQLGGAASTDLRRQVSDLADLLVALADEAVQLQVHDVDAASTVPATLSDARDHLRSLRAARREVEGLDAEAGGRAMPGT